MIIVFIINEMVCGEKNTEKNSEFQMGIEPTTFRTLINDRMLKPLSYWELSGEQVNCGLT